ncbi:MAG: (Fe-S)-binding protein [Actinomycetes bacterium]
MRQPSPRPRVALFGSCAADLAMTRVIEDSVTVLEAAGFTVDVPAEQTCCGQMALNSGHPDPARVLMRRWIDVFSPYGTVVSPSGSCTATVSHQYPRVLEPSWRTRAEDAAGRTYELTQLLSDTPGALDRLDLALDARVAWHDSCHMLRSLGEATSPRTVLSHVRGLELTEVPDHDVCCGFGGTFATKFPELSCAMADRKLDAASAARVDALVSADPGCLLHLGGRSAGRERAGLPVVHVASLLRTALPDRRHTGLAGALADAPADGAGVRPAPERSPA